MKDFRRFYFYIFIQQKQTIRNTCEQNMLVYFGTSAVNSVSGLNQHYNSVTMVIFLFFFFDKVSELDIYIFISVCIQITVSHNLLFCLCLL